MHWLSIILIPLISAFIGWFSNWILVNMLFHPRKPLRMAGITFHGIFPRRQAQLAQKLGKVVSNELLSFDEIGQKITSTENLKKIMPVVEEHIDEFLRRGLKEKFPMVGMFIGEKTINQLKTLFMSELETIFPVVMKNYVQNLQQDLNLEQMIVDKVMAVNPDQLEAGLYQNIGRDLRLVGLVGGMTGLVIGVVQVLLMWWLQ